MSKKPEGIDPEAWARANEADAECQRNSCKEDACNGFLCVRALRIAILAAVEAEREGCAAIASDKVWSAADHSRASDYEAGGSDAAVEIADAIRQRGQE